MELELKPLRRSPDKLDAVGPVARIFRVVPDDVGVGESANNADGASLFPEELAALGAVAERRFHDFARGRSCAHQAMRMLGVTPAPVLRGSKQQPIWPSGLVGSITHGEGYCAAVVARAERYAAIGIDAETNAPLPEEVAPLVMVADERQWLRSRLRDGVNWDRLIFSAKESVYKAFFALSGQWLGFEDVVVSIEPDTGTFRSRFLIDGPNNNGQRMTELIGRYFIDERLMITAICVALPPVGMQAR